MKASINLPNYKSAPTFQSFLFVDNDDTYNFEDIDICHIEVFVFISWLERKVRLTSKAKEVENMIIHYLSQKIQDIERVEQSLVGL